MGNGIYRPTPRRIFNSEEGNSNYYDYGANQITGWRHAQEDRYICLPKFYGGLSMFAVYDGHGDELVVQYLQRYLHQHIIGELNMCNDPELALYLGFHCCENCVRNMTDEELSVIKKDLVKEFEIPDKAERRQVISDFGSLISTDSAGTSKDCSDSNSVELKSAIASTCLNQLPSVLYLTQAPLEENDESDKDYEPDVDDIEDYIFEDSKGSYEESEESCEESEESFEELEENRSEEQDENENRNKREVIAENKDQYTFRERENEENSEDKKNTEAENNSGHHCEMDIPNELLENRGNTNSENVADTNGPKNKIDVNESLVEKVENSSKDKEKVGFTSGSTATVVLVSTEKVYIANVGDSRCVACINGQAVDLSVDHKPTDKEENIRIINAGGTVSEDGRINGILDMSRAFGDFEFKKKEVEDFYQILSCEPSITTVKVTADLEFIIIATDGIWNTMDSSCVVNYLRNRMQEPGMELRDICGELFEELLPSHVTIDGSGCDNMTAIVIRFKNPCENSNTTGTIYEEYKYFYPPLHKHTEEMPEANDGPATREQTMLPNQDCEEIIETEKHVQEPSFCNDEDQIAAYPSCSRDYYAQPGPSLCDKEPQLLTYPSTSGEQNCMQQELSDDQDDDIENLVEPIPGYQAPNQGPFGSFPVFPVPNRDYSEQVPGFQSGADLGASISCSQMSVEPHIPNNNKHEDIMKELNVVMENLLNKIVETNSHIGFLTDTLGYSNTYVNRPGCQNQNESSCYYGTQGGNANEDDDDDVVIIADFVTVTSTIQAAAVTAATAAGVAASADAVVAVADSNVSVFADVPVIDLGDDDDDAADAAAVADAAVAAFADAAIAFADADAAATAAAAAAAAANAAATAEADTTTYEDADATYEDADASYEDADASYENADTSYEDADASYEDADASYEDADASYEDADASYEDADASYEDADASYEDADASYEDADAHTYDNENYDYDADVENYDPDENYADADSENEEEEEDEEEEDDDDDVIIIDDIVPHLHTRTESGQATTSNESGAFKPKSNGENLTRKRTAENANTVTKKMKTDDHTIPNAEKHK